MAHRMTRTRVAFAFAALVGALVATTAGPAAAAPAATAFDSCAAFDALTQLTSSTRLARGDDQAS